jgi:hypothetical protein
MSLMGDDCRKTLIVTEIMTYFQIHEEKIAHESKSIISLLNQNQTE